MSRSQHDDADEVDVPRQLVTMTMTVCVEERANWCMTLNGCAKTRQSRRRKGTGCAATDSQKCTLASSNGTVATTAATDRVATEWRKRAWVTTNGCAETPSLSTQWPSLSWFIGSKSISIEIHSGIAGFSLRLRDSLVILLVVLFASSVIIISLSSDVETDASEVSFLY